MPRRSTRLIITLVVTAGVVVAAVYGLRALFTTAKTHLVAETCSVGSYTLDPDQASVAATMVGAVNQFRTTLPERATVLALAAALQESKLTNLAPGDGDRDSVGVLQQRPSQGWGKITGEPDTIATRTKRLTDVGEATREFLEALVKVSGWRTMPLADAVQAVQISADGSAYAQQGPEAQALADALQGFVPAGITCEFPTPTQVAAAPVVARQAREQLGITTPAASGDTVRVPGAHWQTASWFVANADRLGIERVSYSGRTWTRPDGWRADAKASATAVVATMHRLAK